VLDAATVSDVRGRGTGLARYGLVSFLERFSRILDLQFADLSCLSEGKTCAADERGLEDNLIHP
jgi:hypothetical protein